MTAQFKDFGIIANTSAFTGPKIKMSKILNKQITVEAFKIEPSKFEGKGNRLCLQILVDGIQHIVFTGSTILMDMIQQVPKASFPFNTAIVEDNDRFLFT